MNDESEASAKRLMELRLLRIANEAQKEREKAGKSVVTAYVPGFWRRVLVRLLHAARWLKEALRGGPRD